MAAEQLLVTEGEERGALLSVEADLLLGRLAPEAAGRLGGDPEISRRHARVSRTVDRHLQIEDLGSANGTFVNNVRIDAPRTLEVGDVIRLGRTVLEVTESSDAVKESARPSAGAPEAESESPSAEAELVLVVTAGSALGRRLSLRDPVVIGRGVTGEGDLRDDLALSRRHARVARDPSGQLTVEDLGSANGTFVNGERVEGRRALNVGDSLRVGTTTLELTELGLAPSRPDGEAQPAPAAPAVRRPRPSVPEAQPTPEMPLG
jgi:pSer/pThr/pTyr-binding forkhead associated (FHA) protein